MQYFSVKCSIFGHTERSKTDVPSKTIDSSVLNCVIPSECMASTVSLTSSLLTIIGWLSVTTTSSPKAVFTLTRSLFLSFLVMTLTFVNTFPLSLTYKFSGLFWYTLSFSLTRTLSSSTIFHKRSNGTNRCLSPYFTSTTSFDEYV